jgi:hypothetical protein
VISLASSRPNVAPARACRGHFALRHRAVLAEQGAGCRHALKLGTRLPPAPVRTVGLQLRRANAQAIESQGEKLWVGWRTTDMGVAPLS